MTTQLTQQTTNRLVKVLLAVSIGVSAVALAAVAMVFYTVLFAPAPEVITNLPLPLAWNPIDSDNLSFSKQHPILHPGDELVGQFDTCFYNVLGGSTVGVNSRRAIVSSNGNVRAPLPRADALVFSVGCRPSTNSVLGYIPDPFPTGTYRVEGMTLAYTEHYSRDFTWNSIWFDVIPNP